MSLLRYSLILAVAGVLAGCSDNSDLRQRIQQVKNSPGDPPPDLPQVETFEAEVYDLAELRDPFTGAGDQLAAIDEIETETEVIVPPEADPNRRREFLESFELDSLTMVGTLNWGNRLFGLVSDPEGLIHRVTQENFIGRNNGKITDIFDDRIELKEHVSDGTAWLEKDAQLALEEG